MKHVDKLPTASMIYDELLEIFDRYFFHEDNESANDSSGGEDSEQGDLADRYALFEAETTNYLYKRIEENPKLISTAIAAVERLVRLESGGYKRDAANLMVAIEKVLPDLRDYDVDLATAASAQLVNSFDRLTAHVQDAELAVWIGLDVSMRAYPESSLSNKGNAFLAVALNNFAYKKGSARNILLLIPEMVDSILNDIDAAESNIPAMQILTDFYQKYTDVLENDFLGSPIGIDICLANDMPSETVIGQAAFVNASRRIDVLIADNVEQSLDFLSQLNAQIAESCDDYTEEFKQLVKQKEAAVMFIIEHNSDLTNIVKCA
jgi:hypothetical protein